MTDDQQRQKVEKKPIVELHIHYTRKGALFLTRRQDSEDWEEVLRSFEDEALMKALVKQAKGKRKKKTKPNDALFLGAIIITLVTIGMYLSTFIWGPLT